MAFSGPEIAAALDRSEFFPVFQPMIELRSGELAGFEALARWQPPGFPIVMPDDFIPAVERFGLMDRLTFAILGQAFSIPQIARRPLILSFNLSPTQLFDPKLPVRLESFANAAGFPLDRLTVEITESALIDDLPRAAAVAHDLKALHCRLALDDFGTGYSSLRNFQTLPFDEIKVDRSFVSSMDKKRDCRKIVASVIGLGQGLGILTVAEGVETREQAEMLRWLGCDLGQGWLFGMPVPAADLDSMLAHPSWNAALDASTRREGLPLLNFDPIPAHRIAQLQAVYDGAPVGLCFLDRNLRYVNLNHQLAIMNGVPAAAHIGRTLAEVIPHVYPVALPFLRRALAGESVTGVEITKPPAHKGSPSQSLIASYHPVRDEAGDVLGISVAVMDVTITKHTEDRLRESEDHFRNWMRLSPNVPWILDSNGEVVETSPNWTDNTGQPIDEAMGNGWLRMLHPDDAPQTSEALRRSLETGQPIDIEYRVRRPGQDWKWMRSRGAPLFDPSGQVVGIYGVVEAIDEQKQISRELEICEAELRSTIDAVPAGIVIADAAGAAIFMVNPRARQTFGDAIFPGQKFSEYGLMGLLDSDGSPLAPEDYPLARSIQRSEIVEPHPLLFRRPNGVIAHLSVSSRPIRSDDGKLIGGMMMIRDPEIPS